LKLPKKLKKSVKLDFMLQICDGLKYLHRENVLHRDLACRNILIQNEKKQQF